MLSPKAVIVGNGEHAETERVSVDNEGLTSQSLLKIQSDPLGNPGDLLGDEMNIFIPQSIQTAIELEYIAEVKNQVITPAISVPIFGIVQDGPIAAYNLTQPTMRVDWKDAMNLISYTSIDDFVPPLWFPHDPPPDILRRVLRLELRRFVLFLFTHLQFLQVFEHLQLT